jgi:hypothetical protein
MTGPEVESVFFGPLAYAFYILAVLVSMVLYYEWSWAKTCKTKVLVLIQKSDGHGDYELVDQAGGSVSLKNPNSNTTRIWPINELSTIAVPYPGVGFVPTFLQKTIQMVLVSESDWEPMTNRSPNKEMIASPAVLGNLMHEKITEAVITVNKEMLESVSGIVKRLGKMINPTIFYVGMGVILVGLVFVVFQLLPIVEQINTATDSLNAIQRALGVPITPR